MTKLSTTTQWFSGTNKDRDLEGYLNKQAQSGLRLVAFSLEQQRGLYRFVFEGSDNGDRTKPSSKS